MKEIKQNDEEENESISLDIIFVVGLLVIGFLMGSLLAFGLIDS